MPEGGRDCGLTRRDCRSSSVFSRISQRPIVGCDSSSPGRDNGDPISAAAEAHNDTRVVNESWRTYIYSEADLLIDWPRVDRHAEQAAEKGFTVRKEKLVGSDHIREKLRRDIGGLWGSRGRILGSESLTPRRGGGARNHGKVWLGNGREERRTKGAEGY